MKCMRIHWRIVLPICGLSLFGLLTYKSIEFNRHIPPGRYFWWCGGRLDSDPLGKHPRPPVSNPCFNEEPGCTPEQPIYIDVDPGWLVRTLTLAALPAFLVGMGILRGSARLGVSEVVSFMASMPLLIYAWFYFLGWLIDRRKDKRSV